VVCRTPPTWTSAANAFGVRRPWAAPGEVAQFAAPTPGVAGQIAWLQARGVTTVALERTGVY
jgi:hypothetical protein